MIVLALLFGGTMLSFYSASLNWDTGWWPVLATGTSRFGAWWNKFYKLLPKAKTLNGGSLKLIDSFSFN